MASRIAGITVEIGGDTTKLSKALESVNKTIKTTQSELKDVNKLLKLDPSNTEAVTQKQRMLKEAIEATKEKLTTLKTAAEQANQQLADGKITQDQYDALQREIVETEQNLKSLQEQAAVTNTTLTKIDAVGEKLQTVGSQVEGVGKKFLPVTAAVTGLGTAAVKTAADFDQEMSKVAAISGATGSDFDSLREKAREMGAKTKFSASEAASAMEYMAMAGWKTGDMLDGIEGIMNLAAASGEDLATTSDIVTDALTAFGLSAADSGHFADILATASSNANTNVSMMGETFKYCAPIAGALGFSAEDTAEAIGLMANSGIKASQAGTSLRSIMNNLAGEVTFAGKNIGGVTIATSNADGSMRSLNDILADCRVAFSGLTESEKAANAESLVGKNAMSGFLALMNAGEGDIDKLRGAIENCDGSAESMAETMQDNLNGQLTILKSQLEELAISFGDLLMPTIRKIVSAVQAFVDKLNSMDDSTRETILKVAALAAAIGPLLIVLGKTISTVGTALREFSSLAKGIRLLSTRVGGATGLFGKLDAALGGVSAPVMAVVAVIGTLVAAFMHLWNTNEEFRTAITNIWNGIVEKVRGFCDQLTQRLNALGFDFKDIVEVLKAVWDGFCQVLAPVFEGAFQVVSTVLGTVLDTLIGLFDVFSNLFQGNWSGAWEAVKGIFSGIWNGIKSIFSTVLNTLKGVADVFLGWFGTDWNTVWESVKGFFEGIWTGISDFFSGILTGIQTTASTVWNGISAFFTGVWTGIKDFFEGIWNGIVSFFTGKTGEMDENAQSTFTGISDFLGGILTGLQTVFSTVWEAISGVVSGVMDAISAVISTVMSVISGDWSTAWENIKSAASTVWEGISGVISGAWEGISSFVSSAVETLGSGLSTAWTGIQTTASSAWDGIKGAISTAWDGIQSGVTSAVETVATGLSGAWEGIQSTASTAWEGIKSGISSAWEGISGFFGGIWDAITGKSSDSTTQMKTDTSNAWSGVEAEAQTAWSGVSTSVSTACTGMAQSVTTQIDSIKASMSAAWSGIASDTTTAWNAVNPCLYASMETKFDNNGIGKLVDAQSCIVTEKRNGSFELEMVYPADGIHADQLEEGHIILAKPSDTGRPQPFRIYKIATPIDGKLTVKARHISYQLNFITVSPFATTGCTGALAGLENHAASECPFEVWTDISSSASFRLSVPSSFRNCLGGIDGSVLDTFGGEYEWDRYTIKLHHHRGADHGVHIVYGKNLIDFKMEKNIESVITGVHPYWQNSETGEVTELPEKVVLVEQRSVPYQKITVLDCTSGFQDKPTDEMMRSFAQDYLKNTSLTEPQVDIDIDFIQLWNTPDYEDVVEAEQVSLCDTVHVFISKLGIEVSSKVTETQYDCLLERYEGITLSNSTVSSRNSSLTTALSSIRNTANEAYNTALRVETSMGEQIGGISVSMVYDGTLLTGLFGLHYIAQMNALASGHFIADTFL